MTAYERRVMNIISDSTIYRAANGDEAIEISHWSTEEEEDNAFWGMGEESGDEYMVYYESVDLTADRFYKLVELKATNY